ncbi:MAG: hypothetical protein MZV63_51410 [Marinilabiliales bacterium]|nr:hypothetical protein [Marinilabiliales bacterium]
MTTVNQAVFEVGDKYVVAFCTRVQEEGIAPLKDVENDIRFALLKDKKAELISAEFNKNSGAGKTLDDICQVRWHLTVQEATQINFRSFTVPGVGTEPALDCCIICWPNRELLPVRSKGLTEYICSLPITVTATEGEDIKLLKERLDTTFEMRGNYEAYEALRKGAKIVDKGYKFY